MVEYDDENGDHRIPKYKSELPVKWLTPSARGKIEIHPGDD